MKNKISLVTLGVADLSLSLRFYRDGLGFEPYNYTEGDDHPLLKMEGSWLALFKKERLAAEANVPVNSSKYSGVVLSQNVGSKQEVDEVFEFAINAGAELLNKPEEVFWGGYVGYFADPDGYIWAIAYNPFTDLT